MPLVEEPSPAPVPCAADCSFDAAQALLAAAAVPLGTERVALRKAGRRVLAEPVLAAFDSPRRDTAAMDGVAVRERDVADGTRRLAVAGAAYPGSPFAGAAPAAAVRVTTGAALPAGTDRVVPVELLTETDAGVLLPARLPDKRHVRPRASDFAAGAQVLAAGRILDARALVVAAAADAAEVVVWRRPRVHVIASGDELVPPGHAAAGDALLPDSLSEAVQLLVRQWGGQPGGATRVPDDAGAITTAAQAALADCDILVMAGGASRGERDFARAGLKPLGLETDFAGVAMKPGKPVWHGRVGAAHVLGLPGNPTAAMTVARLFLVPLLTALEGRGFAAGLDWQPLPLAAPAEAAGPREAFLCAARTPGGVAVLDRQSAASQAMLALADLLVRRPAGAPALAAGERVEALRF
ncbi:molybdopterin molybdotransferase MoeA [Sphingomonas desiccabilis]|uniref:Molybdopterin molybdenumtransferase n=1 Tax=Sphingomonas desiccabilis TaxID=429134 RepID=A0A4Q2IQA5_9SPHN|nr:molybdopterin molybdotransferase MoeA [Sphingomonas desiccabilis]MBB3912078.1 molybdopterin molybdotransferase [Sphingomonas desiccabilis]RXZ30248.1 molybdopterin molybdenumtransferase MoeA [Sphingomonas desiccabilis]